MQIVAIINEPSSRRGKSMNGKEAGHAGKAQSQKQDAVCLLLQGGGSDRKIGGVCSAGHDQRAVWRQPQETS